MRNKQEEIREGIARRIHIVEKQLLRVVEETSPCNCIWEELSERFKGQYLKEADRILSYLHSQDVVITKYGFYSDLMEPLIEVGEVL